MKIEIGDVIGHQVQSSFYCSEVYEIITTSSVLNYKVKALFSISNGIKNNKNNTGVITKDNINQQKLKKMLKKNPEWFV